MRIDVYLKLSRLLCSRNAAKQMCDAGGIIVNGQEAKSSREVSVGDRIEIHGRIRTVTARILAVPVKKQVSRTESHTLYEIVGVESGDPVAASTTQNFLNR